MVETDDDPVVGHKSFSTGELDPETGFPRLRHEPIRKSEADAMWKAAKEARARRAQTMPDEQSALNVLMDAYTRLKELGWREIIYCPKDGTHFDVIEADSTGVFDCYYDGEWPHGSW